MISYQFEFHLEEGSLNTFLLGSKTLFTAFDSVIQLLSKAIDVEVNTIYKMNEIDANKITYILDLDIRYPLQGLLWGELTKEQIDNWFRLSLVEILSFESLETVTKKLNMIAGKLSLDCNFIFLEIGSEKLKNSLEELKKLSILLFMNLNFTENKG